MTQRLDDAHGLMKYDAARRALAEASRVDEVLEVRDIGVKLALYAKVAKDSELIDKATDIRLRAERRLGEMIAEQKATTGLNQGVRMAGRDSLGGSIVEPPKDVPTLAEAGIDKKLSSRAQKLAAMPPAEFEERTAAAKKEAVASVTSPRAERVREKQERRAKLEAELGARIRAMPGEKAGLIMADPEYKFKVWSAKGMLLAADNHYPTSELEAIKDRRPDIDKIAAPDCVLALWTTVPFEAHAHEVMKAWGFTYKTQFAWDKITTGTGYWNLNQHEILLIGTRGRPPAPAQGPKFSSVIREKKREHSRKPEKAYRMLETMFPNLPKIELNARRRRKGWMSSGTLECDDPAEEGER